MLSTIDGFNMMNEVWKAQCIEFKEKLKHSSVKKNPNR